MADRLVHICDVLRGTGWRGRRLLDLRGGVASARGRLSAVAGVLRLVLLLRRLTASLGGVDGRVTPLLLRLAVPLCLTVPLGVGRLAREGGGRHLPEARIAPAGLAHLEVAGASRDVPLVPRIAAHRSS